MKGGERGDVRPGREHGISISKLELLNYRIGKLKLPQLWPQMEGMEAPNVP